jgi:hypothetical protein
MLIQAHLRSHRKKNKNRMENANKKCFLLNITFPRGDFLPLPKNKKHIKMLFH